MTETEEQAPPEKKPRRFRRIVLWVLLSLILIPLGVIAFAVIYLRHQPFTIAERDRVPKVSRAALESGLRLKWLGVTCYEITDGKTVLVTDPALTRPRILELITGPLETDKGLTERELPRADFILLNHAHYDHAIDAADVALRTGATVIGTASAANLMRSRGVPESQIRVARSGEEIRCGSFVVRPISSRHSSIMGIENPMSGTIAKDAGPLWFWQYAQDGSFSYHITGGGSSLWFHPSVSYQEGDFGGLKAMTIIQGVAGGSGLDAERFGNILQACGADLMIPTHYDNFFQPFDEGLALLPVADLERARRDAFQAAPDLRWLVFDYRDEIRIPADPPAEERR